jgi:hypothetical protein
MPMHGWYVASTNGSQGGYAKCGPAVVLASRKGDVRLGDFIAYHSKTDKGYSHCLATTFHHVDRSSSISSGLVR